MKFSIIIPVYNVERYLRKCLDSVCNQDFKDYEIIVVDDGSTDKSIEIIREFEKEYDNISVIQQANGGLGSARNTGIKNAKGDYLIFLDSDDFIEPNSLSILNESILKYNSDVTIFGIRAIEENGLAYDMVESICANDLNNYDKKRYLLLTPSACNKVFKKELFTNTDIRFPEGVKYEDTATTRKLIAEANKVVCIDCYLYNYIQRSNSIMHGAPNINDLIFVLNDLIAYFTNRGYIEEYKEEIESIVSNVILYIASLCICQKGDWLKTIEQLSTYLFDLYPNCANNKYCTKKNLDEIYWLSKAGEPLGAKHYQSLRAIKKREIRKITLKNKIKQILRALKLLK